ncbi:hypothetical protein V1498_12865 [Peribacillus sp. SCS-26]|uniref:hypothetical protein n=1 Tax=Paraperibacillus marinus TaxID=3115295 RepID=UPI003905A131
MLSFEEKLAIIESFSELEQKKVSLGRINFQYNESVEEKKNVVYHLHPNGNGYVYGAKLNGYPTDDRGMVNIRDFSEGELRTIIEQSIFSLSAEGNVLDPEEEEWVNGENQSLTLIREEEDMWNVYAGMNLDGTFTTYSAAASYLEEEGFTRK